MARNSKTSALIDGVLNVLVSGGVLMAALAAPNIMKALDRPLRGYMDDMDERAREREVQRVLSYMCGQKLIARDYKHGFRITPFGRLRLRQRSINNLYIAQPARWDHIWRLVLFDIPEDRNRMRRLLTGHLRDLGFQQLQQSAWIYPFPCEKVVQELCIELGIAQYVSYLEIIGIQNESCLIERFSNVLKR